MSTPYTDIYDLFTLQVKDYKLNNLYAISKVAFNQYLQGWLIFSIVDFQYCNQDLSNRNDISGMFNIDLSDINKTVLAKLMVKYWLYKEVQDVTQMELHIQDKDFKTFAEANNLQQKSAYLAMVEERCSLVLTNYSLNNKIDWNKWLAGNFMVI